MSIKGNLAVWFRFKSFLGGSDNVDNDNNGGDGEEMAAAADDEDESLSNHFIR